MSLFSYLRFIYKGIQKFEIEIRKKTANEQNFKWAQCSISKKYKDFCFQCASLYKEKKKCTAFFFLRESRMFTEKCYSLSLLKYPTSMCSQEFINCFCSHGFPTQTASVYFQTHLLQYLAIVCPGLLNQDGFNF